MKLSMAFRQNLLAIVVLTLLAISANGSSNVNCGGSIGCKDHTNRLQDIRGSIADNMPEFATFSSSGSQIACSSYHVLGKSKAKRGIEKRRGSVGDIVNTAALDALLISANTGGGDAGVCAFYKSTNGATFARDSILTQLDFLYDNGCAVCGNVPVHYPLYNGSAAGILTVDYVSKISCSGYCAGDHDPIGIGGELMSLAGPVGAEWAPGWCGADIVQYGQSLDNGNYQTFHYDVYLKDANQMLVGNVTFVPGGAGQTVNVDSVLPAGFEVTATSNDENDPLNFAYDDATWNSTDTTNHQVKTSSYNSAGARFFNTGFTCCSTNADGSQFCGAPLGS